MTKITALAALGSAQFDDVLPIVDVHDATMAPTGTTKAITVANLAAATQGLQYLTGGGALTTAMVTSAQSAGYAGWYLDPRYVWNAAGLVFNGVKNFRVVSQMQGSIGWSGGVQYNASGYISTGTGAADGIQVYASSPTTSPTQGVVFENCVIAGANPGFAVLHLGGGQRDCGLVNTLAYNTSATAGSYGAITDTALSDNNGENNTFMMARIAGAYAALGIGIADQTQHSNDNAYYDLRTHGGTYSVVANNGGNHTFINYYDRSAPATATVWNHGAKLVFVGGEDFNQSGGVSHLLDASGSTTVLTNRAVTAGASANTISISAGNLVCNGRVAWNGTPVIAESGGTVDLTGMTGSPALTVSGAAGALLLPQAANANLTTSGFTGTVTVPPAVAASGRANSQTTAQTVTWTPPAVSVRFRVSVWIHVQTAGTSTVPSLTFTGFSGGAFSQNLPMWQMNGSAAAPTYTCPAVADYMGTFMGDTDASGTAIAVTITPTGSTFRYSIAIERLT